MTILKNTEIITKLLQQVMCDSSLYKPSEFFSLNNKKILISIIRDLTKESYQKIGEHFNKTWFAVYKAHKDTKEKNTQVYQRILAKIKKLYENTNK